MILVLGFLETNKQGLQDACFTLKFQFLTLEEDIDFLDLLDLEPEIFFNISPTVLFFSFLKQHFGDTRLICVPGLNKL